MKLKSFELAHGLLGKGKQLPEPRGPSASRNGRVTGSKALAAWKSRDCEPKARRNWLGPAPPRAAGHNTLRQVWEKPESFSPGPMGQIGCSTPRLSLLLCL